MTTQPAVMHAGKSANENVHPLDVMNDIHRRVLLAIILCAIGLLPSCQRSAPSGADRLRFPTPDRPVAPIISPAYSDEKTRDENGEAGRVMDRLGIVPGVRVADIGAGDGYYTVRLARRLGPLATIYAQDVQADYLKRLEARLEREQITGVMLVLGAPRDPKLPAASIDLAILAHMYHEIENPYEFLYRLRPALVPSGRIGIIDADRPTQDHGTPPALLRCELAAVGYRQVDFLLLAPADGYLAIFAPPDTLPRIDSITPCKQSERPLRLDFGPRRPSRQESVSPVQTRGWGERPAPCSGGGREAYLAQGGRALASRFDVACVRESWQRLS